MPIDFEFQQGLFYILTNCQTYYSINFYPFLTVEDFINECYDHQKFVLCENNGVILVQTNIGPFILRPRFLLFVEIWFEKSGSRKEIREKRFEKSG